MKTKTRLLNLALFRIVLIALLYLCSFTAEANTVIVTPSGGNDTTTIQSYLSAGYDIQFTPGQYNLTATVTLISDNQKIFCTNGSAILVANLSTSVSNTALVAMACNNGTIDRLGFATAPGNKMTHNWHVYLSPTKTGNTVKNSYFSGNTGRYLVAQGQNITVSNNVFYGSGSWQDDSLVLIQYANGFNVISNSLFDATCFGIQTLWSRNGYIQGNYFNNPMYWLTKYASSLQSNFTFTFPSETITHGLWVTNICLGDDSCNNSYIITSADATNFNVNLKYTQCPNNAKVDLFGWRSGEPMNINSGSSHINIQNNDIEGSGDSGIVICSTYTVNGNPGSPVGRIPVFIDCYSNYIRNIRLAGIAINNGLHTNTMTSGWSDLRLPTTTNYWDDRVTINLNGQLAVKTGGTELGYWIPAQTNLAQCSVYHLNWDQGNSSDWSYVGFNSWDTNYFLATNGIHGTCGFAVLGTWVGFYINHTLIYSGYFTPVGENGLHHFDVDVDKGDMVAIIDGASMWNYDLTNVGNGTNGIGYFSIQSQGTGAGNYGYLDNYEYHAINYQGTSLPLVVSDNFNIVGGTSDQNYNLESRQLSPYYIIKYNNISDCGIGDASVYYSNPNYLTGYNTWTTCIRDMTAQAFVNGNYGYRSLTNYPKYIYNQNTNTSNVPANAAPEFALSSWGDLNNPTQNGDADDSRISLNSTRQLIINTGSGGNGLYIAAQKNLAQSSQYHVSWDQGNSNGWSYVGFNSYSTNYIFSTGGGVCGFVVNGTIVEFYANRGPVYDVYTTPKGENGLHHIDVTVLNGVMNAVIDGVTNLTYNLSSIGTGTNGIGYFSIQGTANNPANLALLDNFLYEAINYQGTNITKQVVRDNFNTINGTATNDQNADLLIRQLRFY